MNWKFWLRREWLWYYVIGNVILIISILITVYHTQIVHWLTPVTHSMHSLKFGWLIPIAILFVISFPPLFGHEIVAILCGLVWGLWIGFAIVAAGTLMGELGNFYAFKYCCRARGEKLEKEKISYACLAKVVRDGGFKIALIARLSVMPGHFTTAIFSTCGMGVITFIIAATLSTPKQFVTVYLGVILEQTGTNTQTSKNRLISDVVLVITLIVTAAAMWYLMHKMRQVKPEVIYARRKARQGKMERANFGPYSGSNDSAVFNPPGSETNIPLNQSSDLPYTTHQRWDGDGRAIGYANDPRLLSPQPQRPAGRIPTYRTESGGGHGTGSQHYDEGSGTAYPGGRSAVRQDSGDSVAWDNQYSEGSLETYQAPSRTKSPPRLTSPLGSEQIKAARQTSYSPSLLSSPSAPPRIVPTSPRTQYETYHPPTVTDNVTSVPLPNPFPDAPPGYETAPR
jgi:uncharacterized membrane protein YdjX (TVP38/TMEM64 family)